jgi:hypothetical protein
VDDDAIIGFLLGLAVGFVAGWIAAAVILT